MFKNNQCTTGNISITFDELKSRFKLKKTLFLLGNVQEASGIFTMTFRFQDYKNISFDQDRSPISSLFNFICFRLKQLKSVMCEVSHGLVRGLITSKRNNFIVQSFRLVDCKRRLLIRAAGEVKNTFQHISRISIT